MINWNKVKHYGAIIAVAVLAFIGFAHVLN